MTRYLLEEAISARGKKANKAVNPKAQIRVRALHPQPVGVFT